MNDLISIERVFLHVVSICVAHKNTFDILVCCVGLLLLFCYLSLSPISSIDVFWFFFLFLFLRYNIERWINIYVADFLFFLIYIINVMISRCISSVSRLNTFEFWLLLLLYSGVMLLYLLSRLFRFQNVYILNHFWCWSLSFRYYYIFIYISFLFVLLSSCYLVMRLCSYLNFSQPNVAQFLLSLLLVIWLYSFESQ